MNYNEQKRDSILKELKENVDTVNTVGETYRSTLIGINDKIIIIAVGSASLFLSFLGVLFSSSKGTSELQFKYAILSIIAFLVTPALLLLARWLIISYTYTSAFKNYLGSRIESEEHTIKILKEEGAVDGDTQKVLTKKEIQEYIDKRLKNNDILNEGIKKNLFKEKVYKKLSFFTNLVAYITLVAAYSLAITFFMGVINIMNRL